MVRDTFKLAFSLLAAAAVLLGALEHEDLILRDSEAAAHASSTSPRHALSADDADSGIQGPFRLHLLRFSLPLPASASKPRLHAFDGNIAPLTPVIQDRRIALAGHVALRL